MRRAFTLVELMVAAVMAFIVVAAGSQLAASMVRATRKYEEQAELGARAASSAAFVKATLNSAAYGWNLQQSLSSTTATGSFGVGHCALSTNICPAGKTLLPLEICASSGVSATACPAPTTTSADAVKTLVPRDGTIEAVAVVDRAATPLPSDCSTGTGTLSLQVKGATSSAWAVDDLVVVVNNNHVNVGRVASAFSANADASAVRVIDLDLGDGADFALDDGGSSAGCSAARSLKRATVMRVKQVILKHDPATKQLLAAQTSSAATAPSFTTLVADVEDFGARFELGRLPGGATPSGTARLCTADTAAIFLGNTLAGGCAGERLNADRATAAVVRVLGLQLGVVLRSRVATQTAVDSVAGVFDRSGVVVASDQRLHRKSFFYVGLPNANAF